MILQTGAFVFAVWQLRGKHADLDQLIETPAQRHDGLAAVPALAPPVPTTGAPQTWPATNEWGAPAFSAALPQPEGDSLYAAEAEAGAEAAELTAAEDAAAIAGRRTTRIARTGPAGAPGSTGSWAPPARCGATAAPS